MNATPLGMNEGDPLPMDMSLVAPATFVGEVVMKTGDHAVSAGRKGTRLPTQVGTDMLFEQIPAYLEFFGFGTATPDELRDRSANPVLTARRRDPRDKLRSQLNVAPARTTMRSSFATTPIRFPRWGAAAIT